MKIHHKDASLLISVLVHSNKTEIKKLSQEDRKICLKAIECFSLKENKGLEIDIENKSDFVKRIHVIQKNLYAKSSPRKFLLIQLICSLYKGILNLLGLRVSSASLYQKISRIKDSSWKKYADDQFFKEHYKIDANCSLKNATILLVSNTPSDPIQQLAQHHIIKHYALTTLEGNNLILIDNEHLNDFPSKIGEKNFTVESWGKKAHIEDYDRIMNKLRRYSTDKQLLEEDVSKLEQDALELENPLCEDLENKKRKLSINIKKVRKSLTETLEKSEHLNKKFERLNKIRIQNLVSKLKNCGSKPNQKLFVIASRTFCICRTPSLRDLFTKNAIVILQNFPLGSQP